MQNVRYNTYTYTNPFLRLFSRVIDGAGRILFFRFRRNTSIPVERVGKILVVRFDQLGDAFYFSPALEYLKAKMPSAEIDVLCTDANAVMFEQNPHIRSVIRFNYPRFIAGRQGAQGLKRPRLRDALRLIGTIRRARYDLFIDPRGEPFVAALGFLGCIPRRIGIAREEVLGFLYTHAIRYDPEAPAWHRFRSMLAFLGIEAAEWRPKLFPTEAEKERVDALIREKVRKPFLAFHVSAGHRFRMWPLANFAALIARIERATDYEFVLLGSAADKEFTREIVEAARSERVQDFAGALNIREVYALLAKAKGFVGNDSVLVHFAASWDIPTIDLMHCLIATSARAIGKNVTVLRGCDPHHVCARLACPHPCPHMQKISVEEVYNGLTKYL